MENLSFLLPILASATPGLEGAPRSRSHENRIRSVISPPVQGGAAKKEGSSSKL